MEVLINGIFPGFNIGSFPTVQQEVLHLKDQISHQSRSNFKLEKDLRFLDSKIALLINHKITVEVRGGVEGGGWGRGRGQEGGAEKEGIK